MIKKRIFLLIAIGLAATIHGNAQTNGRVTDKREGKPIEGALVQVKDTNIFTYTDADGYYDFGDNLYAEEVIITYDGYSAKKASGESNMEIQLNKVNWWTEKPKWQLFVGLQEFTPSKNLSSTAPGLMIGFVKNIGVYAQVFYRPGKSTENDLMNSLTNGKTSYTTNGYLGGIMVRLNHPIYLYGGCGVTTLRYYGQDIHGQWGLIGEWGKNAVTAQLGLMFRYKIISVNASAMYRVYNWDNYLFHDSLNFEDHLALNVGVSYWF